MRYRISRLFRRIDPGSQWAFYTILGMVGLWGGALLLQTFISNPPWLELVDRGQLFLYSVGFLTSSLYMIVREWPTTHFPHRLGLLASCLSALIIAIIMFSGATLASATTALTPPTGLIAILGAIVLVVSLVIGYMVARAEEGRQPFDYEAERNKSWQRVEGELEDTLQAEGDSS